MDRQIRAEWLRLLHGELSDPAARQLREQIRNQPELEQAFLAVEQSWRNLELPPPAPAPPGFAARVMARARETTPNGLAPVWWKQTLAGRFASAAVLAGGIVLGALLATPSESEEWSGYLAEEPSWAESYLAEVAASDHALGAEDDS